jgi:hypothetical protein
MEKGAGPPIVVGQAKTVYTFYVLSVEREMKQ